MSDSTQLVPYTPLPDFWKDDNFTHWINGIAALLSDAFSNIENQWIPENLAQQNIPYEQVVSGSGMLNAAVIQPVAKSTGAFLNMLSGLEKDSQSAQSLDMDAEKYQALKYAVMQSGGDREAFEVSVKNLNAFWNTDKVSENLLNSMGIKTRGEGEEKRDNADVFIQLAAALGDMNQADAGLRAGLLGIDEDTLNAMHRGLAQYTDDYQNLVQITHSNATQNAGQSTQFMIAWRKMTAVVDLFGEKSGAVLAQDLSGPITSLTEKLLSKAPQIENVFNKIGGAVAWFSGMLIDALSGTIDLITDVANGWDKLDNDSQMLVTALAGLTGAWLLFNSAFMTSPVGIILALVAAIGLLYDDYQKWKSGGNSLIDWEKWQPGISAAVNGIASIASVVKEVVAVIGGWETVFKAMATYVAVSWTAQMVASIGKVVNALSTLENVSAKASASRMVGKAGFAGAAAVALEPIIDKGMNWVFGDSDYYQRIRTAPTWKDFGKAVIGEGDARWIDGKWIDNRRQAGGKTPEKETGSGWLQKSGLPPPSLNSLSHLSNPGVESTMLSGYGHNDNWRFATQGEMQAPASGSVISPTFNNRTEIVINNARDPIATGEEVERRQLNVYARQAQFATKGLT